MYVLVFLGLLLCFYLIIMMTSKIERRSMKKLIMIELGNRIGETVDSLDEKPKISTVTRPYLCGKEHAYESLLDWVAYNL